MGGAKHITLTIAFLLAASTSIWAQSRIPWVSSWQEASTLAQRHHRLVLIHFWSQNCPPCLKLEQSVFNRPEVIRAFSTNYIPLKVNVDENADLARYYRVTSWPTDVIVTSQGTEIFRTVSPPEANRYIATLDQVAAHTRIGAPISGSPSTDVATTSPGEKFSRTSAFPAGGDSLPSSSFPLPSNPASNSTAVTYGGALPYGTPRPESGRMSEEGAQPSHPAVSPSYVTNQYATPQSSQPAYAAPPQSPVEQRASYTSPADSRSPIAPWSGADQKGYTLPTGASPPDAARSSATWPGSPQMQGNAYVAQTDVRSGYGAASSRPAAPSLPSRSATTNTVVPPQLPAGGASGQPTVGLEGYCPVTLVEQERWVKGDPKWGAVHRGHTYLFTGPGEQQRFLADFNKYAPALSGYDCVKYAEQGTLVAGARDHGVFYRGEVFLFADEAALRQFWSSPDRYVPFVRAEQQRQAARPGDAQR